MKHARMAAMESIVLGFVPQTVRMIYVTMQTERVPVNLDGKELTAAKVNIDIMYSASDKYNEIRYVNKTNTIHVNTAIIAPI